MSFQATNPTENEIIDALAKAFSAPPSAAIAWLTDLSRHFNPKAHQDRLVELEGRRADQGYIASGRNEHYEGLFDGETQKQAATRRAVAALQPG